MSLSRAAALFEMAFWQVRAARENAAREPVMSAIRRAFASRCWEAGDAAMSQAGPGALAPPRLYTITDWGALSAVLADIPAGHQVVSFDAIESSICPAMIGWRVVVDRYPELKPQC